MKLFTSVIVLLSGISAWTCDGARGPRPDFYEMPVDTNSGPRPTPPQPTTPRETKTGTKSGACPAKCSGTCDASDYNDKCVSSWRTNCPDGCAITKYVKELDSELDGHWQKVVTELTKLQRKSDQAGKEMHITLTQLIIRIKEILKNIKKEKDQFLAIKRTYDSVNIDGILAQQRLSWTALDQKRAELQIALSNKQKKFREEANFCKVSFREYDEQVCDITSYVQISAKFHSENMTNKFAT